MNLLEVSCRGEKLLLFEKEIYAMTEQDWFLSLLLKYNNDTTDIIELCEDIDIVKSVIETLRYKKLILYNNISLEHMEMLCDRWCVPGWIIEEINKKKEKLEKTVSVNNETIHRCFNCNAGFKMSENTNNSCRFHKIHALADGTFRCCNSQTPCVSGYHIPYNNK